MDRAQLHPHRRRKGLDHGQLSNPSGTALRSRTTPTRETCGAISVSNPATSRPNRIRTHETGRLPPGRARLLMKPLPTGSRTRANTIGTVRFACCSVPMVEAPDTECPAERDQFRRVFANFGDSPQLQWVSIRTLRPTLQPDCYSPCTNALMRACYSGSSRVVYIARRCAARALEARHKRPISRTAAAPPRTAMNSRRLMCSQKPISCDKT